MTGKGIFGGLIVLGIGYMIFSRPSGIVITNINWKKRTVSFLMNYKNSSEAERNFKFGDNTLFTHPSSKYDFQAVTYKDSIIISILENGNTLFEKEINFATKSIV